MSAQQGSVTTEAVLVTPVLLALLALVVAAGRIGEVRNATVDAAQQAARAASLRADPHAGEAAARRAVAATLDGQQIGCADVSVAVDTTRFARGGDVTVAVTCTVDLADVIFAGLPGTRTVRSSAVEIIDTLRAGS